MSKSLLLNKIILWSIWHKLSQIEKLCNSHTNFSQMFKINIIIERNKILKELLDWQLKTFDRS